MKFLKKHYGKLILFTVLTALTIGLIYAYNRLPIVTGYAAKDMCSCVFVADRDPKNVEENEFQFSLIKYANTKIDLDNKTVTATVLGMGAKTAYFHPQKGCAILNETDAKDFLQEVSYTNNIVNQELVSNSSMPNVDYDALQKAVSDHFMDDDKEKPYGTRTVLVLKDGQIIAEQYAEGFNKDTKQIGWSMTKSIFSGLIGIALEQNYIGSIDEKSLFKEWKGDDRKDITLKQLLQMNTGLEWTEDYGDISEATVMLYDRDDMISYAKNTGVEGEKSKHWEYSSGTSNLLSGLLRQRFGDYDDYFKFPYEQLFSKIGAPSFVIETDPKGNFVASSYAWANARDWAKFGQLYANEGMWNGERILPEGWTKFTAEVAEGSNGSYGAQFWLPTIEEYPNSPKDMYFADGFQGQRIFIIPSQNVVIVRLGLTRFEQPDYDKLVSEVLKAIK
jgi:CubicO group peptidase (beta-lactamase class C family)